MTDQQLKEKYPAINDLTTAEQIQLFIMMRNFQDAAIETIAGGEDLLKMCDGCAFKKGTEANNSPVTICVAITCVLQGEPFSCHKRFNANGGNKLCNGWINVMNNKDVSE